MILCPYTKLDPVTDAALHRLAPHAHRVDVSGDDLAYFDAVARGWGRDVVIIEHDVVLRADVLTSFDECPHLWCTFGYHIMEPGGPILDRGLGCVRFRAELANIGTLEAVVEARWRPWRHLDGGIAGGLEAMGLERHVHGPPVEHRNHHVLGHG